MASNMTNLTTLKSVLLLLTLCLSNYSIDGKKHKLKVEDDQRRVIDLTTFGFLQDGFIQVQIVGFSPALSKASSLYPGLFGFTLDKMSRAGMSSLEDKDEKCLLTAESDYFVQNDIAVLVFSIDFQNNQLKIIRNGEELRNLTIMDGTVESFEVGTTGRNKRSTKQLSDSYLLMNRRPKRALSENTSAIPHTPQPAAPFPGTNTSLLPNKTLNESTPKPLPSQPEKKPPLTGTSQSSKLATPATVGVKPVPNPNPAGSTGNSSLVTEPKVVTGNTIAMYRDENGHYNFNFTVEMLTRDTEGLYKFTYHNCYNQAADSEDKTTVNFTVFLIEKNGDNYLSAGHIPLPTIYFVLSVVFLGLACFWLYVLKRSTEGVYKLHYLMLALVYIKSLALLFHAVNYHFLATQGHHEEAIAIIYYITYLMRGILLFVTIVLIGAGWAFVKYILSDRDKKIFLVVIPLQIMANVAQIITEETEEGESQYLTWSEIFIVVDLLCCGAILFPVVWSIRHLQEASETDGKAAINLIKLKLFRHFYILIVCYIYFTRIIVYLLRIAVPFQYEWMDDFFREAATLVFYIVTGYKFRPASNNPYLQVPQDSDDEVEMDEVVTQSGVLEGITKVNVKVKSDNGDTSCGVSKRESSHDYD